LRSALLDALHAQWRALGAPLAAPRFAGALEVVDPEALLWCSLEFAPSEPRLDEALRTWFAANRTKVNRQRLNTLARNEPGDPRRERWQALDAERIGRAPLPKPLGRRADDASTLLLRARDLLGNDCRAFLVVQLLGSPRGVRLRDVARASGYTYRSVLEAASGWQRAGVVRLDRGHCVLADPAPWCALLRCDSAEIVTIDWRSAFAAAVDLLRTLESAREHAFDRDHALVVAACRAATEAFDRAAAGVDRADAPVLAHLREAVMGTIAVRG
jgi:hypothetical protein